MTRRSSRCLRAMVLTLGTFNAMAQDARLRDIVYDAHRVVQIPVARGVVTLILFDEDEAIQEVASGLGADCTKPEAVWCIAGQPGGRTLFVKPKSGASAPNSLAVVTDRRTHVFSLELVDGRDRLPIHRLHVKAPAPAAPPSPPPIAAQAASMPALPPPVPSVADLVSARLRAKPTVVNAHYEVAEGKGSADIVPSLVFDDGRFTYFRFSGNREVPAVFHVLADGSETLVNSRMEDDLLVADRVSRRLMLRSGSAVVGIWNEAFDPEGLPPSEGTTVPGVQRKMKTSSPPSRPDATGATP